MAGIPQLPPDTFSQNAQRGMTAELLQIETARRALRALDAEVTRTEARMRLLPARVPAGVGAGNATARLNARSPFIMLGNRGGSNLGPVKLGKAGIGLNPAFLKFGGAALGAHVVAGIGNQLIDTRDELRKLQGQGATQDEQARKVMLRTAGGVASLAGNLTGIVPAAKMLLRAAGNDEADIQRWADRAYEKFFATREEIERRKRREAAQFQKVQADINKQLRDDNAFLEQWTPDDFDVANDFGRKLLRDEITRKNRDYLHALADVRTDAGLKTLEHDNRGD